MSGSIVSLPLLGVIPDGKGGRRPVHYPGDAHLLCCARAGSGKNRCVILPNLIRHHGSALVLDPKGENATETSRWRVEQLGQVGHIFDPFKVVADTHLPLSGRASFDPVDFVRASTSPMSSALLVGDALVIPGQHDSHWGEAAQNVLAAFILYVATDPRFDADPDLRTMATVWRCLSQAKYHAPTLAKMAESPDVFVSSQAQNFLKGNEREIASIKSTLMTQCTKTFSEPAIIATMERSSVHFASLSRTPSTVYIVLPGSLASVHSRYMRLLTRCALAQIEDGGLDPVGPGGARRPSTLFILDEFATLGHFPTIVEAMGRMRGYGIKFWTFVQNLSQLRDHYKDGWENIPGNAGVVQYFGGTNDVFTSEYISKLTGQQTITTTGTGVNTNPTSGVSSNFGTTGRPLLLPDEVRRLPDGVQLLSIAAKGPVKIGLVYRDRDFPDFAAFRAAVEDEATATMRVTCPHCGYMLAMPRRAEPGVLSLACSECGALSDLTYDGERFAHQPPPAPPAPAEPPSGPPAVSPGDPPPAPVAPACELPAAE